jgi:hypothetical protein
LLNASKPDLLMAEKVYFRKMGFFFGLVAA